MTRFPFKVVCVDDRAYILPPLLDENGVVIGVDRSRPDERLGCSLTIGKVYEVRSEHLGMWGLIDDTGEAYLFPKSRFRVVE